MQSFAWPTIFATTFVVAGCTVGAGHLKAQIPPDDSGGGQAQIQVKDSRLVPEHARMESCLHTQRDLTVPWHRRRYWCGNDLRSSALRMHNVAMRSNGSDRHEDADEPVAKDTRALPAVPPVATVPRQRLAAASLHTDREMVRYLSLPETEVSSPGTRSESAHEDVVSAARLPAAANNARVWFAKTRSALGPQGIRQALSLLSAARETRRVTLLGLYRPDELAGVGDASQPEERFSVARSLAVRELWRSEGMDVSKVTILHHREDRAGRHVEVTFYD